MNNFAPDLPAGVFALYKKVLSLARDIHIFLELWGLVPRTNVPVDIL